MPHAAVIAAAVTVGAAAVVGTAVALEMSVFRPWREENWPEGIVEGVRSEWDEFRGELRRGLWELRDSIHGNHRRSRSPPPGSACRETSQDDDQEMREMQQELNDFESHEEQMRSVRQRMTDEMGGAQQEVRRRKPLQGASWNDRYGHASESRLIDADISDTGHADLDSPHHDVGEASPTISYASLKREESTGDDEQIVRSRLDPIPNPTGAVPSTVQSGSASAGNHTNSVTSDEDWFSRASSPRTGFVDVQQDDGNVSDAWTQLEDSLPGTPTSGSWSAVEQGSASHSRW